MVQSHHERVDEMTWSVQEDGSNHEDVHTSHPVHGDDDDDNGLLSDHESVLMWKINWGWHNNGNWVVGLMGSLCTHAADDGASIKKDDDLSVPARDDEPLVIDEWKTLFCR